MANACTIPRSWIKRETLRVKGQFWTPDWTADFMAAYVLQDKPDRLLDPALGGGVFFHAAKRHAKAHKYEVALFGRDIDKNILAEARSLGLSDADLRNVEIRDFVLDPPAETFPAIIVNPPYIRHHRLSAEQKELLRGFARMATGRDIDGRAGLHVYFLIRSLLALAPGGRLAFIVSADICEGVFSSVLWQWICSRYRLDAVVTFTPEATPFPGIDTNALVFLIGNKDPVTTFTWIRCKEPNASELIHCLLGNKRRKYSGLDVYLRTISEALETGLSRPPTDNTAYTYRLGDFASVMRGIVTGDNDFFFMTHSKATKLGIPDSLFVKAIGRTRDIEGETIVSEDIRRLESAGRPTRLLHINGVPFNELPLAVQRYLREGEEKGLPQKTLIKTRKPWYRMEARQVPPLLFAYLGRRNARFIRNLAGVVPLTCLLCVYPKDTTSEFVEGLWSVLSNPKTIENLRKVGKTYGSGAIKVEPRALERLPLPDNLVRAAGLDRYLQPRQGTLDFNDCDFTNTKHQACLKTGI
ncbi:MAG TPA: N-6 DNA methylase [Candidatus Hydrogenedentes bacterium]|nr:N-6 DNA methylase [Candidatus Hydrogenedentota bacterium]HOV74239.1 N-6 DNA methylase [Candidatus Hydrogenedentota bacterium]